METAHLGEEVRYLQKWGISCLQKLQLLKTNMNRSFDALEKIEGKKILCIEMCIYIYTFTQI